MTRLIAHISDLHLLAHAPCGARARACVRTRVVSMGRPLDVHGRAERVLRAIQAARAWGAEHLVVSGDLTETGHSAELEMAAEIFDESGFSADRVTLVPGNHDRYGDPDAWSVAMRGSLAPYARSSAAEVGKVVDLGSVLLLPIDVTKPQSVALATGFLSAHLAEALERRLVDIASRSTPVVVVQHHPPYDRGPIMRWLDGLLGWERETALFRRHHNVQVLHGHLHEDQDKPLHDGAMRIFGAPAVVEDGAEPRVRLYEVAADGLVPWRAPSLAAA